MPRQRSGAIPQQQGQQAGLNGKAAEEDIQFRLWRHGYIPACFRPPTKETKQYYVIAPMLYRDLPPAQPFFIPQMDSQVSMQHGGPHFQNMYGGPMRADFYIFHPERWALGLIIESKFQSKGGSVDQKFPYALGSLRRTRIPGILVIIGEGFNRWSLEWVRRKSRSKVRVLSWNELVDHFNRGKI
jgi:hypothetical protein